MRIERESDAKNDDKQQTVEKMAYLRWQWPLKSWIAEVGFEITDFAFTGYVGAKRRGRIRTKWTHANDYEVVAANEIFFWFWRGT